MRRSSVDQVDGGITIAKKSENKFIIIFSPIVIVIWAVVFVEMTRLTGSVWPAVLMHTVEDAIPNYLVFEEQLIQFTGAGDFLFNPLRGIFPLIAFLIFGL